MVFQKKIIIGSIMSFIATGIGIIAVFFPDLFNLQKEKIVKYSLFLNDEKSILALQSFMKKNIDRVIDLNILYCSNGYNPETEQYSNEESINQFISIDGDVEDGLGAVATVRTGGYIDIKIPNSDDYLLLIIDREKNAKKSDIFFWQYDGAAYNAGNEKYADACRAANSDPERLPDMGELSGTFFLTESNIPREYTFSYSLEPLTKSDLKLKNY